MFFYRHKPELKPMLRFFLITTIGTMFALLNATDVLAQAKTPVAKESDYYRIVTCEVPENVELEATAFQLMPDGRVAVSSRRGEIWMIEDALAEKVPSTKFKRFAHGLHEPIGMALRDGQRRSRDRI